jgi:hypothetical protein
LSLRLFHFFYQCFELFCCFRLSCQLSLFASPWCLLWSIRPFHNSLRWNSIPGSWPQRNWKILIFTHSSGNDRYLLFFCLQLNYSISNDMPGEAWTKAIEDLLSQKPGLGVRCMDSDVYDLK